MGWDSVLNKDPGLNLLKQVFQKFQVAHSEFSKLIALDDIIVRVET